ncbi:MAG TPA: ABC transporter permease, partial [Candidatus Polarisedimenticolia bacterium]|nr:ABC transporter permease [Candidatus Polarisedimenticolia bacterium]
MDAAGRFLRGLLALFRRDRLERDLDEELRAYADAATDDKTRGGMDRGAAQRAVRLEMGGLDAVKEQVRDAGWETGFESFVRDVRYGARILRRHPGFSIAAILTLALGIGANTALFSVVNAVLLRPLPYPDSDRLVTLEGSHSLPDIVDLAEMSSSMTVMGTAARWDFDLVGEGEPRRVVGELAGEDLFPALGVQAALGRTFDASDDRARAPVVVIGDGFWRSHLGADPGVVGRRLQLSGALYEVIGVMPPHFRSPFFGSEAQVWIPFRTGYPEGASARGAHFTLPVARLASEATLPSAQAELTLIGRRIAEKNPTEARAFVARMLRDRVVGDVRQPLLLLLASVALVLLVACANYASLLLARGAGRGGEMRLRLALGAARGRLVRQLVTESALLSLLGGLAGAALAGAGLRFLLALRPAGLPALNPITLDGRALGFALLASLVTGVLFGLAPAWQVARGGERLQAPGATMVATSALRRGLVVAQLSLALVLLTGAGLLLRSFWILRNQPSGFEPQGVLTMRLSLPAARYESIEAQQAFLARLEEGVRGLPGAGAAGLVTELPLSGWRMMHNMIVEGDQPVPEGQEPEIYTHEVSPGYFAAAGTPILRGRGVRESDTPTAPLVGVVNEAFVRRFSPDRDPLGLRARWARGAPDAWMTIVGVAADARFEDLGEAQEPTIYTPFLQKQQPWKRWAAIVVRPAAGDPMTFAEPVRQAVRRLDAALPITDVKPMSAVMLDSMSDRRFHLVLLSTFAGLAFVLAVVGVYGVLAHLVAQRSREVGVRMALGARRLDVLWLMLRQGLPLIAGGVAFGAIGAMAATRLLRGLLYGVSAGDPA